MSSPTVVENPLRQTRRNNNDPRFRKLLNKRLTTKSWKNFGKTMLPKWSNKEVGKVEKKTKGLFGRFYTNKITGPENTTTKESNQINSTIITNARTTNYDLIRRLWRQFKEKSNEIDFIPRIDTLEKIGKFELELECFKNKDKERNPSGRDSIISRFIYLGYSAEEANTMLCNYTSESTNENLKQRLLALKLPIDTNSSIIDNAVTTLTLPDELQKEKMKIVTNLIILRLIVSDELIVRLKSNNSKVVETSFGNLTTFGQVLQVASFLSLGVSILFFLPGFLLSEYPQEYMDYQNNLEVQLPAFGQFKNMTANFLNQRYDNRETRDSLDFTYGINARTNHDWLYADCQHNKDYIALHRYITMTKDYILTNNKLPTPEIDQELINQINQDYPLSSTFKLVPDTYTKASSGKTKSFLDSDDIMDSDLYLKNELIGDLRGWAWITPGDGFYKLAKAMGWQGSIAGVKSVIIGATSWTVVGGAVLLRKLHGLLKQYLSETAKKDISDFIDRFLLEFPVAINLIRNPEYIESFSTDTTLNLQIQLYIGELLKKLNDERRGKLSQEERNAENAENAEKFAKLLKKLNEERRGKLSQEERNAENAEKFAKAEIQRFQGSTNETATNETATNETANNETANNETATNETATNETANNETAANETAKQGQKVRNKAMQEQKARNKAMQEQKARNAQRNAWPKPIRFNNLNAKGGRRSYRQKRRSATKKRKTQRKN